MFYGQTLQRAPPRCLHVACALNWGATPQSRDRLLVRAAMRSNAGRTEITIPTRVERNAYSEPSSERAEGTKPCTAEAGGALGCRACTPALLPTSAPRSVHPSVRSGSSATQSSRSWFMPRALETMRGCCQHEGGKNFKRTYDGFLFHFTWIVVGLDFSLISLVSPSFDLWYSKFSPLTRTLDAARRGPTRPPCSPTVRN